MLLCFEKMYDFLVDCTMNEILLQKNWVMQQMLGLIQYIHTASKGKLK